MGEQGNQHQPVFYEQRGELGWSVATAAPWQHIADPNTCTIRKSVVFSRFRRAYAPARLPPAIAPAFLVTLY